MSVYFDASLIVSLLIEDNSSERASAYIEGHGPVPVVSDFAAAEVASAIGLRVRSKRLSESQARAAFADFDAWRGGKSDACWLSAEDVTMADSYLRRLDLSLRTPDALNIAIAARLGVEVATFDEQMKTAAGRLGLKLAPT